MNKAREGKRYRLTLAVSLALTLVAGVVLFACRAYQHYVEADQAMSQAFSRAGQKGGT